MKFKFKNRKTSMPRVAVSLIGKNPKEIKEKSLRLSEHHVDMIEWRADTLSFDNKERFDVSYMIEILNNLCDLDVPIIFTLRTSNEGGYFDMTSSYDEILMEIMEKGKPDFIDIEYKTAKDFEGLVKFAHDRNIDVIGSYHNFKETPDDKMLLNIMTSMEEKFCDVVKVCCIPNEFSDVRRMLSLPGLFHKKCPDRNVVCISLGIMGRATRLYGERNHQCMTFAAGDTEAAPGQISYLYMREFLDQIHEMLAVDPLTHNIYICGFMGTGKTTTSKVLSDRIHLPVIEMDEILEAKFHLPITHIFDSYGEEKFRKEESELLKLISESGPCIVSCGGGVCLNPDNIEVMKETGSVVVLEASPETIRERTKDELTRPLLKASENNEADMELFLPANSLMFEKEMVSRIERMMKAREASYKAAGNLFINTENRSPENVAFEIIGIKKF
ncbi:MAG: type I 3-dehydroquinate dehydratase [Lachnospiraceae bacterium]|nr:type I 3-dehydroquinate dehydratase [Lachnospiraceae bacterium]